MKVNSGIELGHDLYVKVLVESDNPGDIKLSTKFKSLSKVSEILLHVSKIMDLTSTNRFFFALRMSMKMMVCSLVQKRRLMREGS